MLEDHVQPPIRGPLGQLFSLGKQLRSLRPCFHDLGIHQGQLPVLAVLNEQDGLPQTDLAKVLHISPPAMTNLLKRLEQGGWIERRRDEQDHRVWRVYVTEKGRSVRVRLVGTFRQLESQLLGPFTEDEKRHLQRLLTKLTDQAKQLSLRLDRENDPGDGQQSQ
ncbi:MarR family transcriptional regulator [Candidatus Bipolaricaulota bacterium]|nr:MarR family transcriptional regulator [Candidatus Bipolaricaulota bacterium]